MSQGTALQIRNTNANGVG